jgi:hypothetical protein
MKQDVIFANVDLDIESKADLKPLLDCFSTDVDILFHDKLDNGNDFASLEFHLNIVKAGIYGEPDKTISAFCSLIENLPLEFQRIWQDCVEKRFDLGFESGNTEKRYNATIKPETVRRIAEIGASLVITIYPIVESKENL